MGFLTAACPRPAHWGPSLTVGVGREGSKLCVEQMPTEQGALWLKRIVCGGREEGDVEAAPTPSEAN